MQGNGLILDSRSGSTELTRSMGARVRQLRMQLGMTQGELAKALGYQDGTSVTFIEQGRNNVKPDVLMRLCVALKTSPNALFGWEAVAG
jgi:transcriptional regulator with XRE-family HTH domain